MSLLQLLQLMQDAGVDDSDFINQENLKNFTNKEFLIKNRDEYLRRIKAPQNQVQFVSGIKFTDPSGLPSYSAPVNLKLENRVSIDVLTKNNNINKTLKGKYFLCRTVAPPFSVVSVNLIVEDPKGKRAVRLGLYNYSSATGTDLEKLIPVGTIFVVKNPYFKMTVDQGFGMRCENPSDVKMMSFEVFKKSFPTINWKQDSEIPSLSNQPEFEVLQLKNFGNKSFVEKRYKDSIRFYTQGLELSDKSVDLLANRGAAFLSLRCYNRALVDIEAVLKIQPSHVKGIFRKVKILWGLKKYEAALDLLKAKMKDVTDISNTNEFLELHETAERILEESHTGNLSYKYLEENKNAESMYVGEYNGPTKIQDIRGKGRGIITTQTIEPGQLIMCCKAFASYYSTKKGFPIGLSLNFETRGINMLGQDALVSIISDIIELEPESGKELYKLWAGKDLKTLKEKDEKVNLVDIKRIDRICTFNGFEKDDCAEKDDSKYGDKHHGLWLLPSYINHSCSEANSEWKIYGDFLIIRAVKQIPKGNEVLVSYSSPILNLLDERQIEFDRHQFQCNCRLCTFEMKKTEDILARKKIIESFEPYMKMKDPTMKDLKKACKSVDKLKALAQKGPLEEFNFFLAGAYQQIKTIFLHLTATGNHQKSVEYMQIFYHLSKEFGFVSDSAKVANLIVNAFVELKDMANSLLWSEILETDMKFTWGKDEQELIPIAAIRTANLKIMLGEVKD